MNISEDKFANKSAEEIISDMLIQHKNDSKEALEHIQDILKDDGLTLSKDIKANLQKAVNILSDKGLKEGWLNNIISNKKALPTEDVIFEVYLPFKKEPATFVTRVSSLDDPQVEEAIQKIRKKHPKSNIYIHSKLGYKKITEEKEKPGLFSTLAKDFLSSKLVKDVAATGLATVTGINPAVIKPISDTTLGTVRNKFENVAKEYKINLYKENKAYTCYAGTLPIALTLAENAQGNYDKVDILKENSIICSYNRSLKEWSTFTGNELKETIYTNDDITNHSYTDLKKDITNIDERLNVIDCGLNPNLIDKRRPKWHNIFGNPEFIELEDPETGEIYHNQEVLVSLNGIDSNINQENPDKTEVTIVKKIPYRKTQKGTTYKNGEEFVITVGQFKKLLLDPSNAEKLSKFENSKDSAILSDEQKEEFKSLDEWAKKAIDSEYPEWEAEHAKEYNLYNYSLPERAQIYQDYKDLNRTNMYQQARELTANEVDIKYGLPKLKKALKNDKEYNKYLIAFENTRKNISNEDQTKLDNVLMKILNSSDDPTTIQRKISKIIGFFGAKAQLNQIPILKGKLSKLENDLLPEVKTDFDKELLNLIANKYVDVKTGLPTILKKPKEALNDVTILIDKYKNSTKASEFNKLSTNTKEIVDVVKQIKDIFNQIEQTNPEIAKQLKQKFFGQENRWKSKRIMGDELITSLNEFLMYCQEIANKNAEIYSTDQNIINDWIKQNAEKDKIVTAKDYYNINGMKELPASEKEKQHVEWIDIVQHIENEDSQAEDNSYYTAITNKISRLIKTDPQAANGYHNYFKKLLKDLETKYPDPNNPEIETALAKFLSTMKDETKGDATITGALNTGLTRKLNKLTDPNKE